METIDIEWQRVASEQLGMVSRRQLRACGLTDSQVTERLGRGLLVPIQRGALRSLAAPTGWDQRVVAACLAAGPGAVASHRTAARLWRLRGIDHAPIEITVAGDRRARLPGVTCHRTNVLTAADVATCGRVPVTSPARTLVGLGAVAPHLLGPAVDDAVLQRLVTYGYLWRTVVRLSASGRNGVGRLRDVIERRDPSDAPTESALEDLFERLCRRAGRRVPRRQVQIEDMRVDYVDDDVMVVCEINGRRWHTAHVDRVRDRRRRMRLRALGYSFYEYTWVDMRYLADVVITELTSVLPPA